MTFDQDLVRAAAAVLEACRERGLKLATAESCTGGLIAACLTEVAGASEVLERGFVSYSNPAKGEMLGVPEALIAKEGAVSEAVARAMAEGALARSDADLALSCTGIAGPGGGTAAKPIGLVHIAAARKHGSTLHQRREFGDLGRAEVRWQTVAAALDLVADLLRAAPPGPGEGR
ncbi:MAG: CinA family protein [Alphaproteobacteria bacterium]|nr:CinA family protein [Alphaproteobacteria bacterium]